MENRLITAGIGILFVALAVLIVLVAETGWMVYLAPLADAVGAPRIGDRRERAARRDEGPARRPGGRNADRAAPFWNTDLSLLKRISIGQRQLVLRADAFNAFNQDNYGIPVVNMANSGFGTNTNVWGRRVVTLSAKFIW